MADRAGLSCLALFVFWASLCAAQDGTNYQIDVIGLRVHAPGEGGRMSQFDASLARLPGVLVNRQGSGASQNDLGMRGSSFSGAGLAIGGLGLSNPQTEHFNSELPFSPLLFSKPEVLTGLDQALRSSGHLIGTVNSDFLPVAGGGRVEAGAGERALNWQNMIYRLKPETAGDAAVGGSVFGGRQAARGIDYSDNDLEAVNGGAHVQIPGRIGQLDLAAARQNKKFGARGYYGVSPEWPADEEIDDRMAILGLRTGDGGTTCRLMSFCRTTLDDYRILMDSPGIYENRHRTDVAGAMADGSGPVGSGVAMNWRVDGTRESIESARLGNHERSRGSLQLLPERGFGPLRVTAGVRGEVFSDEEPAVLPQGGLTFELTESVRAFASYTETVKQPSYTELNYESPGSLGNSGLEREKNQAVEVGLRWARDEWDGCRVTVFSDSSRHRVDWVKVASESERWTATDIGDVRTYGAELRGQIGFRDVCGIEAAFTWLKRDFEGEYFGGRYVLDYPEHMLQLVSDIRLSEWLVFSYVQLVRRQNLTQLRGNDRVGSEGRVEFIAHPFRDKGLGIALACDNVWDDDFETYVGQPAAGRRSSVSVSYDWR